MSIEARCVKMAAKQREGSEDPRYDFTNQRIIEILDVTPEEETEMKTVVSDHTRLRRDRKARQMGRFLKRELWVQALTLFLNRA